MGRVIVEYFGSLLWSRSVAHGSFSTLSLLCIPFLMWCCKLTLEEEHWQKMWWGFMGRCER